MDMAKGWGAILLVVLCAAVFTPRARAQNQDQNQNPPQGQTQGDQAQQDQSQQDQSQPNQQPAQTPAQQSSQDQSQPRKPATENDQKPDENKDAGKDADSDKDKTDADKDKDKKDEGATNPAQVVVDKTKDVTNQALTKVRDWETEWLIGAYVGRNRKLVPLTWEERKQLYLKQTFLTPAPYIKAMFDAGFDQARGWPHQWDDGVAGYTERWASREGQFFASNTLATLGNAKLHYEVRYDQCRCHGFWPRTKHAILRNFLTYNETESEMRPQWALYGGAFGGGLISTAWKPKPRNPFAEGGRAALGQIWYGTLLNFFTEFAVDINRKLGVQKTTPPQ